MSNLRLCKTCLVPPEKQDDQDDQVRTACKNGKKLQSRIRVVSGSAAGLGVNEKREI